MSKEVKYHALLKELNAGHALPKPPVSIVLGPAGVNLEKFCEDFNEWSKDMEGIVEEVVVVVYSDLSYDLLNKEQYLEYKRSNFAAIMSASNIYKEFKDKYILSSIIFNYIISICIFINYIFPKRVCNRINTSCLILT